MKAQVLASLLMPALVYGLTANNTAIPGMIIEDLSYLRPAEDYSPHSLEKRAPPYYEFHYGSDSSGCNAIPYASIRGNKESPCSGFNKFDEAPGFVQWDNPKDPSSGKSYWNMILYFEGDSCPVVGHPIQCDSPTFICLRFAEARPLSYNIVPATTGIRNCDPL